MQRFTFKALLHCVIFSATCLAMLLRDKLPENCTVYMYNMACLASEALHKVDFSSNFRNGLQQLATPLHSVSPLQHFVSHFYVSFNKGACAHFLFSFRGAMVTRTSLSQDGGSGKKRKLLRSRFSVTPNRSSLQCNILKHCQTSC